MSKCFLKMIVFSFFILIFSCNQEIDKDYPQEFLLQPAIENYSELGDYRPASISQVELIKNSKDSFEINYGISFGQCVGFCEIEKQFTSNGILSISKRLKDNFIKTEYQNIDSSVYDSLIKTIDFEDFITFDENTGYGDCADGGNEWLTIRYNNKIKTVSGTFGFDIEPLQELIDYLRRID